MKYDPYCGANLSDGAVSFLLGMREGEPADAGRLNEGSNNRTGQEDLCGNRHHAADYHAVVVAMCFVNRSYK